MYSGAAAVVVEAEAEAVEAVGGDSELESISSGVG